VAPIPQRARLWSHAALQEARFAYRLRVDPFDDTGSQDARLLALFDRAEQRLRDAGKLEEQGRPILAKQALDKSEVLFAAVEDPGAPPSLCLPDGDCGEISIAAPGLSDLAVWVWELHTGPAEQDVSAALPADRRHALASLRRALAELPRSDRLAELPTLSAAQRRAFARRAQQARRTLQKALDRGLERRLGQHLTPTEEKVYLHLAGRDLDAPGVRVCEDCLLVFEALSAKRCPRCRHSPARAKPKPWHTAVYLGDRSPAHQTKMSVLPTAAGAALAISITRRRGTSTPLYECPCRSCGEPIRAADASQIYCADCSMPAARTARSRKRNSRMPRAS